MLCMTAILLMLMLYIECTCTCRLHMITLVIYYQYRFLHIPYRFTIPVSFIFLLYRVITYLACLYNMAGINPCSVELTR